MLVLLLLVLVVGTVGMVIWLTLRETRRQVAREAFIRHGALPLGLFERLRQKHPIDMSKQLILKYIVKCLLALT